MGVDSGILDLVGDVEVKFDLLMDPGTRSDSLHRFRLDVDPTYVSSPVLNLLFVHQDRRTSGIKTNVGRLAVRFGLDRDLQVGSSLARLALRTGLTVSFNYLSFTELDQISALVFVGRVFVALAVRMLLCGVVLRVV